MTSEKYRTTPKRRPTMSRGMLSVSLVAMITALPATGALAATDLIVGDSLFNDAYITNQLAFVADPAGATDTRTDNTNPGSASASASRFVLVSGNEILNIGEIDLGAGTALELSSFSSASANASSDIYISDVAGPYSGSASAVALATSASTVAGNTASNEGLITADVGIGVTAEAYAYSDAYARSRVYSNTDEGVWNGFGYPVPNPEESANASATAASTATATATVSGNSINQSGQINAVSAGIDLSSIAMAAADTYAYAYAIAANGYGASNDTDSATATSEATASTDGNIVTNTGDINVSDFDANVVAGIRLYAEAGGADESNVEVAIASVSGNTVVNAEGATVRVETELTNRTFGIGLEATSSASSAELANVSGNSVNNAGTIWVDASGDGAGTAIMFRADDEISGNLAVNSGLIRSDFAGITLEANGSILNNSIRNSGRIEAQDYGISLWNPNGTTDGNLVENSGLIVTDVDGGGVAIQLSGDDTEVSNDLSLSAPSYLAGRIFLDRDTNTDMVLTSGVSHSVYWIVSDDTGEGNLSANSFQTFGPVVWFQRNGGNSVQDGNSDEFATIDPSALAAAPNQLADLSGLASSLGAAGLDHGAGFWFQGGNVLKTYAGDEVATMDQSVFTTAGAVGVNGDFDGGRMGIMVGYGQSSLKVGSVWEDYYALSHDNRSSGAFVGANATFTLGSAELGLGVAGGRMAHRDSRFVNDNYATGGQSYADATYNSTWLAPELSLSATRTLSETLTVTPMLKGRYMMEQIAGYTETGTDANATFEARTLRGTEVSLGVSLDKQLSTGVFNTQVELVRRGVIGGENATATLLNDTEVMSTFASGYDALRVGLGYQIALGNTASLDLHGGYLIGENVEGGDLGISIKVDF